MHNNLDILEQYYFERDYFIYTVKKYARGLEDFIHHEGCDVQLYNFRIFRYEDEFYIVHLDSGTIINWYKNLGRTNTCNKEITKDEFIQFLILLNEDILSCK